MTRGLHGVEAGHLTARLTNAALQGAQRRPGTAQVKAGLHVVLGGVEGALCVKAQHQQVTGHAVQLHDAGAVLFTDIGDLTQLLGVIDESRRWDQPHGMELMQVGVLVLLLRYTANDAATIAGDVLYRAVPIVPAILVGLFQLIEQLTDYRSFLGVGLQISHKAGPRPLFQLIQHWSI